MQAVFSVVKIAAIAESDSARTVHRSRAHVSASLFLLTVPPLPRQPCVDCKNRVYVPASSMPVASHSTYRLAVHAVPAIDAPSVETPYPPQYVQPLAH